MLLAVAGLASMWMVLLALQAGDMSGALLFFGFAMLLGLIAFALIRQWDTGCAAEAERTNAPPPAPVRFVPHRFMMAALILTALAVLAAIVVPLVFR